MTDLLDTLGLTVRTSETVEHDGRPARRVVLSRTYPTDVDDLWSALTDAARIPRWFLPVTGDLRVGGTYQLEGNAGGTIQECLPPSRFRITWGMGDGEPVLVTVTLAPDDDGTRMELEQLGPVPPEFWDVYGPGATGIGWDLGLHGLALYLASGVPNDAEEWMAWMTSPEGFAFVRATADAWQQADLDGGTAADDAGARAERTYRFYTGQGDAPE